jgi:hypothetical protein
MQNLIRAVIYSLFGVIGFECNEVELVLLKVDFKIIGLVL